MTDFYFQCKNCKAYLSTSKWDRHISNSKCSGEKDLTAMPATGVLIVSFTQPILKLHRVTPDTVTVRETEIPQCSSKVDANDSTRPRRNSFISATTKLNQICSDLSKKNDLEGTSEWNTGHKTSRSILDLEVNPSPGPSKPKKKTGRPPKQKANLDMDTCDNDDEDDDAKKAERLRRKLHMRQKRMDELGDRRKVVRKYNFACHLCPAKFTVELEHRMHVENVHHGKRKLMACCVCGRVFNKRDALNGHILNHELAEVKENEFQLFEPWDDEFLQKQKKLQPDRSKNFYGIQTCKVCLLHHYYHFSYLNHFLQEHADPPESFVFSCHLDKCPGKFKSVQELVAHAKSEHPVSYYGKVRWNRMVHGEKNGGGGGGKKKNVVTEVETQVRNLWSQRKTLKKERAKAKRRQMSLENCGKSKKKKSNRKSSGSSGSDHDLEDDDEGNWDFEDENEDTEENLDRATDAVKRIKVEVVDDINVQDDDNSMIKNEPYQYEYAEAVDDFDVKTDVKEEDPEENE